MKEEQMALLQLAGMAMAAHVQAAWSNPGPSNKAFEDWKKDQPPGGHAGFQDWIAEVAAGQAGSLWIRLVKDGLITDDTHPQPAKEE